MMNRYFIFHATNHSLLGNNWKLTTSFHAFNTVCQLTKLIILALLQRSFFLHPQYTKLAIRTI